MHWIPQKKFLSFSLRRVKWLIHGPEMILLHVFTTNTLDFLVKCFCRGYNVLKGLWVVTWASDACSWNDQSLSISNFTLLHMLVSPPNIHAPLLLLFRFFFLTLFPFFFYLLREKSLCILSCFGVISFGFDSQEKM